MSTLFTVMYVVSMVHPDLPPIGSIMLHVASSSDIFQAIENSKYHMQNLGIFDHIIMVMVFPNEEQKDENPCQFSAN